MKLRRAPQALLYQTENGATRAKVLAFVLAAPKQLFLSRGSDND